MKIYPSLLIFYFTLIVPLLGQNRLNPELLWQLARLSDEQISPDKRQILYGLSDYSVTQNNSFRSLYIVSTNGGEPRKILLGKSAYNARWRPDMEKIGLLYATDQGMQLFEINPDGTDFRQITTIEGGIDNFQYAPNQQYISFTRLVKTGITVQDVYPDLPLVKARIIDQLMYRHWDDWDDYHSSHVFYTTYSDGQVGTTLIDIMQDEPFDCPQQPFGGTEDIVWSPDSKSIVYVSKKLNGTEAALSTNSDLYQYDLVSGQTVNISQGMEGCDTQPVFSPDGKQIAFLSMARNGFESDKNEIYSKNLTNGLLTKLTVGFDASAQNLNWAEDGKKIYFTAGINATHQVFEVDLKQVQSGATENKKNAFRQITQGQHDINSIQLANNKLIGSKVSMSAPADLVSIDLKSGNLQAITNVNKSLLSSIKMGNVEQRWVPTTDKKQMLVWVIYPPDFDPAKKYPTLLYCQGGPQSAVSQFFSYRWNFQLMAAQGYIIVAPNRRGLPSFGQEWNDQISGDWGGQAMRDYLSAIDAVSQEKYVDKERLAAVGASYGGYSVYYLAGIHEKRFKSFVAHCGLFNLESWYGSTEEMFFANWDMKGAYWENPQPKSYQNYSPHTLVGNWDTPMLVIHSEKDFRVPITQGMEAFNAAQLQKIPSKFLYFPDEGHWITRPQNGILWQRVFFEWLKNTLNN